MVQLRNLDVASTEEAVDMFNAMCWVINQKAPGIFATLGNINFATLASFLSSHGLGLARSYPPAEYRFRITAPRSLEAGNAQQGRRAEATLEILRNIFKVKAWCDANRQHGSCWAPFVNNLAASNSHVNDLCLDLNRANAREITCAFLEGGLVCSVYKDDIIITDDIVHISTNISLPEIINYFTISNIKHVLEQPMPLQLDAGPPLPHTGGNSIGVPTPNGGENRGENGVGLPLPHGGGGVIGVPTCTPYSGGNSVVLPLPHGGGGFIGVSTPYSGGNGIGLQLPYGEGNSSGFPTPHRRGNGLGLPLPAGGGNSAGVLTPREEGNSTGFPTPHRRGNGMGLPLPHGGGNSIGIPTSHGEGNRTGFPTPNGRGNGLGLSLPPGGEVGIEVQATRKGGCDVGLPLPFDGGNNVGVASAFGGGIIECFF